MATYQDIKGLRVKYLSADPSTLGGGDVWYNSTTGTLKGVVSFAAWSSGSSLTQKRYGGGGAGTQTSALAFAGANPGAPAVQTEEYNGSGWSTGGDLNTGRYLIGGSGTQTAALASGGDSLPGSSNATEEYDGSTWTTTGALNTTRKQCSGQFGIQTAAVLAGGYAGGDSAVVEEYDGSSWTSVTSLPAAQNNAAGFGTLTAGIYATGTQSPNTAVLAYDGTNWTAVTSANTGGSGRSGAGTSTAGIIMGASTPSISGKTEEYDGSTWTETADLGTSRYNAMGANTGTTTASLVGGGATGSEVATTATEEFNKSINTVTAAAWAAGGTMGTARYGQGQFGPQTAAICAAGSTAPATVNSESYDGSSWTEGPNVNTARGLLAAAGNGTQTAGLIFGGTTSIAPHNPGITNASEEYNGSSWTSGNNLNYSARNLGGLGTQTSAVAAGGLGPPTYLATSDEYDGTNWTAGTSLPAGLQDNQGMTGASQTTGLLAGGEGPPGAAYSATLEYDGTNWTAGGSLLSAVYKNAGCGTQTAALSFGGQPGPHTAQTEGYDGTVWSTRPSMATARSALGGSGTQTAGLAAGGQPPIMATTEEFTGETSAAAASTLTTS